MKSLNKSKLLMLILGVTILYSCKKDSGENSDEIKQQLAQSLVNGSGWVYQSHDYPEDSENADILEWSQLEITFSLDGDGISGTYTTTGADNRGMISNADDVWPLSGIWRVSGRTNEFIDVILRDGETQIIISVDETSLNMRFEPPLSQITNSRVSGIEGEWDFTFVPK